MLNWSVSSPVNSRTVFETELGREQMNKLVVDLKAQVAQLKDQLAGRGVPRQLED